MKANRTNIPAQALEVMLFTCSSGVHEDTLCRSCAGRDNRFLGWADIGLTKNGELEARRAARTLEDFGLTVDEMFCSYLKRSIKSAWLLADEMDQVCASLSLRQNLG